MLNGLLDDGVETVVGHGRSFRAAAEAAYGSLPEDGYVEVVDDAGVDLGSRERYESSDAVEMDDEAMEGFELKAVVVEYRHDPSYSPSGREDDLYHPLDELDGLTHPNDELSGVEHPLDSGSLL